MFKFKVGEIVVHEHIEDLPEATVEVLEFRSIRSFLAFKSGEIVPRDHPDCVEDLHDRNIRFFYHLKLGKLLFFDHVEELEIYVVF